MTTEGIFIKGICFLTDEIVESLEEKTRESKDKRIDYHDVINYIKNIVPKDLHHKIMVVNRGYDTLEPEDHGIYLCDSHIEPEGLDFLDMKGFFSDVQPSEAFKSVLARINQSVDKKYISKYDFHTDKFDFDRTWFFLN